MTATKTYILAGSSSAMAKATAHQLREAGHEVISISRQAGQPTADPWYTLDGYDFGKYPVLDKQIHGLVYFPGTIRLKPFGRISPAEFQQDMSIHALGAAAFVQAYLPQLDRSRGASIVLMSSVAAGVGMPYHSSLSMAKGAVEGLTRALAAELAPSIRVNAIAPGLVDTPLSARFLDSPEKKEAMDKKNPLRRVGTAAEIARVICFLLSEQAGWISGQVLSVDGGMKHLKIG